MGQLQMIEIKNGPKDAIKTGAWFDPGAKLYDILLDSFYCKGDIPAGAKELEKAIKDKMYLQWFDFLKEAYLEAPITKIQNSPYGRTPYSKANCKYPHHIVKKDKLLVSIPGLKAAYKRACQTGAIKNKEVREHLERHIKELGLESEFNNKLFSWTEEVDQKIEDNFNAIFETVLRETGINLFDYFNESTDAKYYRVTHNGVGIYEAAKKQCSSKKWKELLETEAFTWLPKPDKYPENYMSYFTQDGIDKFNELTLPVIEGIIGNNIKVESFDKVEGIVYQDQFQVVCDTSKAIKESLDWIEEFINNDEFRESVIDNWEKCTTPAELLEWMDCIQYGWIDKSGQVQGTGDEDDEEDFYKEYRLQTPTALATNRVGVCWDQTELERDWFHFHYTCESAVIYIEIEDGKGTPTHTFLIYENGTGDGCHWFEHSWGIYKGDHTYKNFIECIADVVEKHQKFNNDTTSPVSIYWLRDKPRANSTCDQFMKFCHKQVKINLDKCDTEMEWISDYPYYVKDSGYQPPMPYDQLPEHLKNDPVHVWRAKTGIELIHKEPTYEELQRIWKNWQLMSDKQKTISDKKSVEFFGMNNVNHYRELVKEYGDVMNESVEDGSDYETYVRPWMSNEELNLLKYVREEYTLETLPDKLYFGTPNDLKGKTISAKEPRGLFLTPYPGIASIFIIDRNKEMRDYMNAILARNKKKLVSDNYNIGYQEWYSSPSELIQPLKTVHMFHNIPSFTEKGTGTSSGYIYEIDISEIKDELEEYVTKNADREIVYRGASKLPIVKKVPWEISWTLTYSPKYANWKGDFKIEDMNESVMYECGFHHGTGIDGDDLAWIEQYLIEEGQVDPVEEKDPETPKETERKKSMPKQADAAEANKNGIRRKKLYIAFIEWAKEFNSKNTFGSLFDKDAFTSVYPFVPEEMRYFYRLANPLLCVLGGDLTFFQVSELRKLNKENDKLNELMIFAATPKDMRVFNRKDKKVYKGLDENGKLVLKETLAQSFDDYIQKMINKGDILNGPEEVE